MTGTNADDDPDYADDVADDQTLPDNLGEATDPADVPADQGDAGEEGTRP